ncbi:MAG: putative acetyltransferase [Devosia sp.]|uniref:GNAT family N-acetyltransferase n=1 Tax=Devosia sp. TaxID=1871048 RepID=UPI00262EE142|nr:GNAT family N-acetyltransferase [Devosia sp.]MDB5541145.1 putative acetyltransferase [Devosia sp.]
MNAPIGMRPATRADASEVALLVNIATHGGIGNGWAHDQRAGDAYDPVEVGRLEMLEESDALNWRNATLAESDGEVVGMLLGYPELETMPAMRANTPAFLVPIIELERLAAGRWFISMLAVHIGWRKGVGSQLLNVAEHKRSETSARGLALITEDVNTRARQLYERRGFAVEATRPMRDYPDGKARGKDWLLMVKE